MKGIKLIPMTTVIAPIRALGKILQTFSTLSFENIKPNKQYIAQATKPPIATAVYPPAARAARTGATKAPEELIY